VIQLSAAWYEEEDGATPDDVLANEEYEVEAAEVVGAEPHTVGSEPYLRRQLARASEHGNTPQ
jgi:hypothetical protein